MRHHSENIFLDDDKRKQLETSLTEEQMERHDAVDIEIVEFPSFGVLRYAVGKDHAAVRRMREMSGARVAVDEEKLELRIKGNFLARDRVKLYLRVMDKQRKNKKMMMDCGFVYDRRDEDHVDIDDKAVGVIIGQGGDSINGLMARHRVLAFFAHRHGPYNEDITPGHSRLYVVGVADQVAACMEEVTQRVLLKFEQIAKKGGAADTPGKDAKSDQGDQTNQGDQTDQTEKKPRDLSALLSRGRQDGRSKPRSRSRSRSRSQSPPRRRKR